MAIKDNYSYTIRACCIAYITQAVAVNFPPLLFLTFERNYSVTLGQISALITLTFLIQLMVDFVASRYVHKIGCRICAVSAHLISAFGLILLGILPEVCPNPFFGITAACLFYSFGSGLIEVLVSPIVESCPTAHKASAMGFLHSFYCWGTAAVILLSTVYFIIFGTANWNVIAMLWAILPIANAILFTQVPIAASMEQSGGLGLKSLLSRRIIWVILLLMIGAGSAELAMGQWASAFAESGLNVSKTVGDIAGPFMFAIAMGTGRIIYSSLIRRIDMIKYMSVCAVLCIAGYAAASLSPAAAVSLAGCALVGFAVGVFWPGTFSLAAERVPDGGTAMFGMLAFAGDAGCILGPVVVGLASDSLGGSLKSGLGFAMLFPAILLVICLLLRGSRHA